MLRMISIALLTGLAVALCGCPKPATEPPPPPPVADQMPAPTTGSVPPKAAPPAKAAPMSEKDAAAIKTVGIAAYPGATVSMANIDPKNNLNMVALTTTDPLDQVAKFYNDKYAAVAAKSPAKMPAAKTADLFIAWRDGKEGFSVTIQKKPTTSEIGIVLSKRTLK